MGQLKFKIWCVFNHTYLYNHCLPLFFWPKWPKEWKQSVLYAGVRKESVPVGHQETSIATLSHTLRPVNKVLVILIRPDSKPPRSDKHK